MVILQLKPKADFGGLVVECLASDQYKELAKKWNIDGKNPPIKLPIKLSIKLPINFCIRVRDSDPVSQTRLVLTSRIGESEA